MPRKKWLDIMVECSFIDTDSVVPSCPFSSLVRCTVKPLNGPRVHSVTRTISTDLSRFRTTDCDFDDNECVTTDPDEGLICCKEKNVCDLFNSDPNDPRACGKTLSLPLTTSEIQAKYKSNPVVQLLLLLLTRPPRTPPTHSLSLEKTLTSCW